MDLSTRPPSNSLPIPTLAEASSSNGGVIAFIAVFVLICVGVVSFFLRARCHRQRASASEAHPLTTSTTTELPMKVDVGASKVLTKTLHCREGLSEKVLDAAQIAAESDLPKPCPPFPLLSPRPVHALRAPAHVEVSSKVAALAALPPPQRLPGPSVKALIAAAEAPESAAPSPVRGTQGRRHLKPMKSSHSFGEISIPDRPASEQREAPPSTRHPRKQREPAPPASPAPARGGTAPQATEHLARHLHVEAAQHHQSSEQQFVAQWF